MHETLICITSADAVVVVVVEMTLVGNKQNMR